MNTARMVRAAASRDGWAPAAAAELNLMTSPRLVPMAQPIHGPTYGMTFRRPAMKAIPSEAENPIFANDSRPMKLRAATPITSQTSPVK